MRDGELEALEFDELPLGRIVRTSVNWFLLRGTLDRSVSGMQVMRAFTLAGMIMARTSERLLDRVKPDRIFCLKCPFFAERILRHVARRRGFPVTTYERGFPPSTWVFRHNEIACEYRIGPDFKKLGDRPLTPSEDKRLATYLDARSQGLSDVRQYWPEMEERRQEIQQQLRLDPGKPIVSLFTNITWDTAVQERDLAFDGMFDWLQSTVETLGPRDDVQLVIRAHPAEVRLRRQETAESVQDVLAQQLGSKLDRVRIVPAGSELASYTLAALSKFVIVYTSTVGLEFACSGKQVVVAGDTHYRGLGFTEDPDSRKDYVDRLARLTIAEPEAVDIEKARRYAHFFFFRFMVPLRMTTESVRSDVRIALRSLDDLQPGRDPVLDTVMRGLMHGEPIFCNPDERLA